MEYKLIAAEIKDKLGVNIFEQTRRQDVVDARSLFCYILRKDYNLTLHKIAEVFNSNGKSFSHCSVIHNLSIYDVASGIDKRLEEIRYSILKTTNPKAVLINRLKDVHDLDRIKGIINLLDFQEQQII